MRKQILVVMASFMMMSSAFPTYAATVVAGGATTSQEASTTQNESSDGSATRKYKSNNADPSINWILNSDECKPWELYAKYGTDLWFKAEAVEQAKKWADDNKGDIPSIADERARYEAIVNKVCDFLEPDELYIQPHIAFTIRDGKGVCADYTTLAKALCDTCGINAQVSVGNMNGEGHVMLKVTLNGHVYYSDPVNYDTKYAPMLMEGVPSYYQEAGLHDDLMSAASGTGDSVAANDFDIQQLTEAKRTDIPEGYSVFYASGNREFFVLTTDLDKLADGEISYEDFYAKYGITF